MSSRNKATLVAYVPAPHKGYLNFFRKYKGGTLYLLGSSFIAKFPSLVKHLPGDTPAEVRKMVSSLDIFSSVRILTPKNLPAVQEARELVMPDEDVSHVFAATYLGSSDITFDESWRLRWDWTSAHHKRIPEGETVISVDALDQELMLKAFVTAGRSSDWWRQIGAVLVRDGTVLLVAYNKHVPSEQSPYFYGDPRSLFNSGEHIDMSTALHAEVGIIAEAARRGIQTEGCDLYVTTFPCPPCAYACAKAGFKRLFYAEGYSLLEGAAAFSAAGTQIIRVAMTPPPST
jgi:dCMP deaminase